LTFQFGDPYFKHTTLLLSSETSVTPFISDASTNSLPVVIQGDTKPTKFTPYSEGYYSNLFDGTGDYLTIPSNSAFAFGTGDFTVECWVYLSVAVTSGEYSMLDCASAGQFGVSIQSTTIRATVTTLTSYTFTQTLTASVWYHIAFCRVGTTLTCYVNGISIGTNTVSNSFTSPNTLNIGRNAGANNSFVNGYISNLRILKGTAVYTTTFTPPTSPLTAITNTSLLTCQSNNLVDESNNNFLITKNGDVTVNPLTPFATPTTATYNTLYSTYFDGTGGYLNITTNAALAITTGDFTIEGWYFLIGLVSDTKYIFDCRSGTEPSIRPLLYIGSSTYNWYVNGANVASGGTPVINTWTHFAVVKTAGSTKLYINGTVIFTYTDSQNYTSSFIQIGPGWTGHISNFRFVKGTAVYTTTFTPSTTPLTAIANTSLLTCQDSTIIDNSPNGLPVIVVTQAKPIAVSPFTMTTGTNTLTTLGSTYFDGTGDYLTIPNNVNLQFGTGDFTVECWIYATSVAGAQKGIIAKGTNTTGWELRIGGAVSGGLDFSYTATGVTNATVVTINSWHHVALTRSGTSVKAFLDGAVVGSATTATDFSQTDDLKIGESRAGSQTFTGYISNVRILKGTALYTSNFLPPQAILTSITNTQLLTLQYNGGATTKGIIDNGPFNNIITRIGNTSQGSFSPYSITGWSNYFDGTTDWLVTPASTSNELTLNFTIEFWFYANALTGGLVNINSASGPNSSTGLSIFLDTGGILSYFVNGNGGGVAGSTIVIGTWYHVALVRSSSTNTLYLNGISSATNSATPAYGLASIGIGRVYNDNTGSVFNGYISNVRIVKGTAVYTTTFTPPTTPLTAITNTHFLSCQSNRLIDNSPNNFTITRNGDVSVQTLSPFGSIPEATPISYSNYFDGTGDYLTAPASTAWNFTGDWTFECWVYPTAITGYHTFLGQWGAPDNVFIWKMNSSGRMYLENLSTAITATSTTIVVNQWQHIALTRSSNTICMFVNGVLDATTATRPGTYYSSGAMRIGASGVNENFTGYISNMRILKGTALYTTAFTPPTTPLTAITNTSLLTCQSTRMIDNSTNAFTITAAGNVVPKIFNPFGYTGQTSTIYTPSTHGGSAYFDGTSDYLTVAYNSNYNIPASTPFTIEGWAYTTATTEFHFANRNWNYGGGGPTWAFFLSSGTTPSWNIAGTGSATYVMISNGIAGTLGHWNHYAWTRDVNNVCRVFTNGVEAVSSTRTDSQAMTSGSGNIYIGVSSNLASNNSNGYLSDLRFVVGTCIYTSSFVPPTQTLGNYSATYPSTLLLNFNTSGIVDAHSSHVLETVGNAQLSTAVKKYGSASMYFDGTGDYLTIPTNPGFVFGTGDFTIEAWFYIVSGAVGAIFDTRSGASGITPLLYFSSSTLRYYMNGGDQITSGTTLSAATWYHVALVRNSGSSKMYLNGAQTGSTYADTNNFTLTNTINIGRGNDGNNVLNGYIDELRITKGFARYTANFTAPTSAFVGQ